MQSPASSTICGTHGARKNVKLCSEGNTNISGKNGVRTVTKPYSERWNGSVRIFQESSRELLVERAVTLYDGKSQRKNPDDSKILVCEECGSTNVEITAWVDANTNEYVSDSDDSEWCF